MARRLRAARGDRGRRRHRIPPARAERTKCGHEAGRRGCTNPAARFSHDARRLLRDHEAIAWALQATGAAQHADRLVDTLSGGERQRAWLAVALAQRTGVLLLDEPTTYLDVRHQLEVMALVRALNAEHGLTVCWVLHDLNAAAAYSDLMVCLRDGRVLAQGPPAELLTAELVRDAFGIDATVIADPRSGLPVCLPHGPVPDAVQGAT